MTTFELFDVRKVARVCKQKHSDHSLDWVPVSLESLEPLNLDALKRHFNLFDNLPLVNSGLTKEKLKSFRGMLDSAKDDKSLKSIKNMLAKMTENSRVFKWFLRQSEKLGSDSFWNTLNHHGIEKIHKKWLVHGRYSKYRSKDLVYVGVNVLPMIERYIASAMKELKLAADQLDEPIDISFLVEFNQYLKSLTQLHDQVKQELIEAMLARLSLVNNRKNIRDDDVLFHQISQLTDYGVSFDNEGLPISERAELDRRTFYKLHDFIFENGTKYQIRRLLNFHWVERHKVVRGFDGRWLCIPENAKESDFTLTPSRPKWLFKGRWLRVELYANFFETAEIALCLNRLKRELDSVKLGFANLDDLASCEFVQSAMQCERQLFKQTHLLKQKRRGLWRFFHKKALDCIDERIEKLFIQKQYVCEQQIQFIFHATKQLLLQENISKNSTSVKALVSYCEQVGARAKSIELMQIYSSASNDLYEFISQIPEHEVVEPEPVNEELVGCRVDRVSAEEAFAFLNTLISQEVFPAYLTINKKETLVNTKNITFQIQQLIEFSSIDTVMLKEVMKQLKKSFEDGLRGSTIVACMLSTLSGQKHKEFEIMLEQACLKRLEKALGDEFSIENVMEEHAKCEQDLPGFPRVKISIEAFQRFLKLAKYPAWKPEVAKFVELYGSDTMEYRLQMLWLENILSDSDFSKRHIDFYSFDSDLISVAALFGIEWIDAVVNHIDIFVQTDHSNHLALEFADKLLNPEVVEFCSSQDLRNRLDDAIARQESMQNEGQVVEGILFDVHAGHFEEAGSTIHLISTNHSLYQSNNTELFEKASRLLVCITAELKKTLSQCVVECNYQKASEIRNELLPFVPEAYGKKLLIAECEGLLEKSLDNIEEKFFQATGMHSPERLNIQKPSNHYSQTFNRSATAQVDSLEKLIEVDYIVDPNIFLSAMSTFNACRLFTNDAGDAGTFKFGIWSYNTVFHKAIQSGKSIAQGESVNLIHFVNLYHMIYVLNRSDHFDQLVKALEHVSYTDLLNRITLRNQTKTSIHIEAPPVSCRMQQQLVFG